MIPELPLLLSFDVSVTLVVFVLTWVFLVWGNHPPHLVLVISGASLVLLGVISPWQFLQGFSHEVLLVLACICIVARAVELQGFLRKITTHFLCSSGSYRKKLFSLLLPVSTISAFFNNTPVVVLLTPIVREWAHQLQEFPSKYLIPLSYASLMGGMWTLIGTSTNLVMQSLLIGLDPNLALSFFELAWIGIPLTCAGYLYLLCLGPRLLPERQDFFHALQVSRRDFAEFTICPDSSWIHQTAHDLDFANAHLLSIHRCGGEIDEQDPLEAHDRLVFLATIEQIAHLHTIKGITPTQDPHFALEHDHPHYCELVIPSTSSWSGKTVEQIDFATRFRASVIAIYRQGSRIGSSLKTTYLRPGDSVLLLSNCFWHPEYEHEQDYLFYQPSQRIPLFHPWKAPLVFFTLLAMIAAVIMGVSLLQASLGAALLLILTQSISLREATHAIPWTLLLTIVGAMALSQALVTTQVMASIATVLLSLSGHELTWMVPLLFALTLVATEILTNTVAVFLIFPLGLEALFLAGQTSPEAIKLMAVTICVAGSCGYALPTGYQTHLLVLGPGGYTFFDFLKIGLPLDILMLVIASVLLPYIWSVG